MENNIQEKQEKHEKVKKKRRDKGDGSIYQRKDGNWVAKYQPPKHDKPKYLYGKTENEVKRKLREFKLSEKANEPEIKRKECVREYMNYWLTTVKKNQVKPKTYDSIEGMIIHQIDPFIGNIQIANVTTHDIQMLINKLVDMGYSYSTIKNSYDALNGCIKWGIVRKDLIHNPCIGVILPKNKKRKQGDIRFFTEDEINLIIEKSTEKYNNGKSVYRLGHLITILAYTGLRIGELLALQWSDINFEKRTANINKNIVVIKNRDANPETNFKQIIQKGTKTASGNRVIYLGEKAINALNEIRRINGHHLYVSATESGKPNGQRNIARMFENILKKCNIEPCGLHSLRHTFASILFKKGVNVKTVSELLGHSNVNITYDTYIHLINEQKREAIALLDEL